MRILQKCSFFQERDRDIQVFYITFAIFLSGLLKVQYHVLLNADMMSISVYNN